MDKYPLKLIGDLCDITKGETGLASATPGIYPLVATGAERRSCVSYQFDTEAVCIPLVSSSGHGKKSLNHVHYQEGKFALGTILCALVPKDKSKLSAAYLHRYLKFNKDKKLVALMKGAANVSLAVRDIAKIEIPVPPIRKQTEFITLFNKLEEAGSTLQGEFATQSALLTQLRQAILQEAIEGKLTSDWRKTHPVQKGDPETDAEALLAKIKTEKQKLIATGKIKKEKSLQPISSKDKTFDIPKGWVWTRLSNVCETITDGDHQPPPKTPEGIPFLVISNVSSGRIDFSKTRFVSSDYFQKLNNDKKPKQNDILYTVTGSYGIPIKVTETQEFCVQRHIGILRPLSFLKASHLFIVLSSPFVKKQADSLAWGVAIKTVPTTGLRNMFIPLPPLAEQRIIVERVEKLLSHIDQLEAQVTARKSNATALLQTVLRDAFEGPIK